MRSSDVYPVTTCFYLLSVPPFGSNIHFHMQRRRKRRDGAPSSGTASPVDWYYYSDTSSRNLSPLAYSPRVTKNSSTNTERPDDLNDDLNDLNDLNDDSDAEFEPFPWVVFDDDDDVTTEPLFM